MLPKGWIRMVANMRKDLRTKVNDIKVDVEQSQTGMLTVSYSPVNDDIERTVEWYRRMALNTCSTCGEYGNLSYDPAVKAIHGRVYCTKHRPKGWEFIQND